MRYFRFLRWRPWMRIPAFVLGIIGIVVGIWIGFPMIGLEILHSVWLRAGLIALILIVIAVVQFFRWRKRRAMAAELEDALTPVEPAGDGAVLSERMNDALATLKKSGGAAYLYDLPWYVIIGPPGAGKTTALRNSGIEFPLSNAEDAGVVSGFGGTRYCDWWFAEDAILIDTAGRYTTQDSDKTADENSWQSFLDLLKKSRPKQPINGVMLAFSVEDIMNATPEQLAHHAEIVRARLGEIHEKLRIDFPVYVMFTKCDLISGFREYFSSFSLNRRKAVWGVTFQTKDRKAQTFDQVADEFDTLVSRLSDELIDRLNEEPDGISRVAIFGLPGQMALMRDNVSDFLRRVFEPTRYKTSAILRGFYFTSGTQEGTPIDQVLGAMSQNDQAAGAFAPAFMSGQGKSFFLHDLLKSVIFEERDWVGHDARAVRRAKILRGIGLSTIGLGTAALLAGLGISFWQNRSMVADAREEARLYEVDAQDEIARVEIDDWDLDPVLPYLNRLRSMPAGYGIVTDETLWNGFGLRQAGRLQYAARDSYGDALEQMLRPRLVLDTERHLAEIRNSEDPAEIYRALKVYMLLAGQGGRSDDAAVKAWFEEKWDQEYAGVYSGDPAGDLKAHLDAMLELDDTREVSIAIDDGAVTDARSSIVRMSLADQAYAIIRDNARQSSLPDFRLLDVAGPQAAQVFVPAEGVTDISQVSVPALYTFNGYWEFFFEQLLTVRETLENDRWVLGEQAEAVNFDQQLAGLDQALQSKYALDFANAWLGMFEQFRLANMVADKPLYDVLGAASGQYSSPIALLTNAVVQETRLTAYLDELEAVDPASLASGGAGQNVANAALARFQNSTGGMKRILIDQLTRGKTNVRANGTAPAGPRRDAERIESQFQQWFDMVDDSRGTRPIDAIFQALSDIRDNLRLAESNPSQSAALMPQLLNNLTINNSRLPPKLREIVNDAERDFRGEASNATIAQMNRALTQDVTAMCQQVVIDAFPFSNSRSHIAIGTFAQFFGPGGSMDSYYTNYLQNHVVRGADGLTFASDSPLFGELSDNMLLQFERAEKIRSAFFSAGGGQPSVPITVTLLSGQQVREATLEINGDQKQLALNGAAQTFQWPGSGARTFLDAQPREVGVSGRQWTGGSWTIVQFMRDAGVDSSSNNVTVSPRLGGRRLTFQFTFDAPENPFTMPELRNFGCPQSVN